MKSGCSRAVGRAEKPMNTGKRNGRHEETRTPDLYRVNFEVTPLKPFSSLAFPVSPSPKMHLRQCSFGDELVTSSLIFPSGMRLADSLEPALTCVEMRESLFQVLADKMSQNNGKRANCKKRFRLRSTASPLYRPV